jgi:hypothetical protein
LARLCLFWNNSRLVIIIATCPYLRTVRRRRRSIPRRTSFFLAGAGGSLLPGDNGTSKNETPKGDQSRIADLVAWRPALQGRLRGYNMRM